MVIVLPRLLIQFPPYVAETDIQPWIRFAGDRAEAFVCQTHNCSSPPTVSPPNRYSDSNAIVGSPSRLASAKIQVSNRNTGDTMLDDDLLLSIPTEHDLPDSYETPVDNELQVLVPVLLRAILSHIWSTRFDWFFGINLGVYYDPNKPAIGPDGFLSLGVQRVRPNSELRLSYVVAREKVMPQWVLEVVSKKPGSKYDEKFETYAALGVLYYTIYNPSHYRRDKHEPFEVYKLENSQYVRQIGNPVWMPELGLGIGHELGSQDGNQRDWLYWYDESGVKYLAPEDALAQERILREREQILREREQLIRRETEERLLQAQQDLEQERRSLALKMLRENIPLETIARITEFTLEQLQELQSNLQSNNE